MSGTPLSVSSSAEKNNSSSDCTGACCESQVLPSQLGCHSSVISRKTYPMNTMILLSSSSPPGSDNASNEKGLLKTETTTQGYETVMDTIGPVVPNSPQRKRVLTPVVVCGSPCMLPQAAVGSPLSAPILSTPSVFGSNIRQENNGLRFCLPCNTKVECASSTNANDVNSVLHQNEPQLRSCAASRSGRQSERQSPLSVPIDNNETVTDSQNRASCSANVTATFDKSSLLTASSPELSNCAQAANSSLNNSSSAGAGRRLSAQQISSCPANICVNVPGTKNVIFNCRSSSDSFNAVPVSEAEKLTGLNRYVLHELKAPRPHAPEIEAIACPSAVEPFRKAWWAGVRPATCERTCRHRSKVCDAIQLCNDCTGYYCKWLADLVGIPVLKASGRVDPLVFHTDPLAKLYWDRISKVVCCPKSMNKCLMCIRRYQLFTHFLPGNLLFRGLVHQSVMKLSEEGFAVDMGLIRKVTRLHLERIAETMELRLPPEYFASLQAYEIILRRGPLVDVIASGLTSALAATSAAAAAVSSVKSGRNALSKNGSQNSFHDNETRRQNNNSSCEALSKSILNNTSASTSNRMCFSSGTLYHYKPRTIKSASHGVENSSVSSPHAFAANDLSHRDSPEMTESSRSKVPTETFCKEALSPEVSYSFLKDNANRGFPSNTSWSDNSNALLSAYGNSWCSAGIASMKSRMSNRVESLESVCRATKEKTSRCCEKCKDDIADAPDGTSLSSEGTEARRRSVSSEIREKEHGGNSESFLPQFTGAIVCGSRRRRHQKHMAQIAANHLQSIAPTAARDEDEDETCGVSKASTRTEPEKKRRPRKGAESEVGSVEQEGHQRHSVENNEQDIMLSQNASSVNNDNNQGLKCGSSDHLKRRLRLRHTLRRPLYKGDSAIYYGDFDGDSQFLFLLNEDKKLKQNSTAEVAVGTQTTQRESFSKQQQHHESENDNEVSSDGRGCRSSKNVQSGNGRKRRRRAFQQRKAKQESLEKGKTVGCNHDEVQENGEVSVADELGFPGCGFDKQLSRSSFLSRGLEAVSVNFTELAHQFSPFSDKQQPENISPSSLHRRPIVTPRRQESFRTAESEEMRDVDCCGSEKHLHSATCHVSAVNRVSQDPSSSSDLPPKPSLNDALHAEQLEEEMRLADAGVRGVFWDPAKEAWCVLLCLPSCLSPSSLCESFRYGLIQRKILCFRAKWDSVMSAKWNAVYERLKSNPVELKHIADCVRRELAGWIKGSMGRHSNEARTLMMSSPGGSHDIDLFIHSQTRDVVSSSTSFVDEYPSYCSKTGNRNNLFWVEKQQQLLDKATSSALHSALLSPVLDSLNSQKTVRSNAPAPCFRDCMLKQWPSCVDGCCNGCAVQQHNKCSDENKNSSELVSCFPPVQRQVEDNKQQACMTQQLETLLSEEEKKETSCMNMLSNHVASLPDEWEGGLCELVGQVICGKLCGGEGKTQLPCLATFEKTKVLPRCTKQEAEQKKLFVASLESNEKQGLAKKSSTHFSGFTDNNSKASIVLAASIAQQDTYLPSCDEAKEGEEDVDCLSGNVKSRSSPTRLADLLGSLSKALGSTGSTVCLDSERQQPSADNIGRECEDNLTQLSSKVCTTHEEGLPFAERCLLEDLERSPTPPTTTTTPLEGGHSNILFPASHKKSDDLYTTKKDSAQLASPIAQDEQRKEKETCGASINDTSENNPQHVSHVADLLVTLHSKLMEQTTVDDENDISLQKPSEETEHHTLFSTTVLNCPASFFSSYLPTS